MNRFGIKLKGIVKKEDKFLILQKWYDDRITEPYQWEFVQIVKEPLPAAEVLKDVGLGERMANFPAQLSGGEQQRVAIARALAKRPQLLLCDEPTGALDYNTGKQILALLQNQSRKSGMTVVIITHNSALTAMADRVIHIKNGTVSGVATNEHATPVEEIEW